ncbi:MAG: DegQ family serine endoprotease [Rhodospirillales bacterium]|jgi:Do/DeqQ family serine protease|nr:DegQ family serine endoprotease [Rhodospirillales bacterium]
MLLKKLMLVAIFYGLFSSSVYADTQVPQSVEQIKLSFAPLVRSAAPAVVNIYTQTIVKERQFSPLFNDPFFQRFFGESFGQQLGRERERVQNSLGSGVIVQSSGVIVTNNHVIEGADKIRVVLSDRREFDASIVGVDDRTDLAVLRIDAQGESLPFIDIRDSDNLEVGDLVLAIGNPFGVGQTVTSGIVSALARTQVNVADVSSFIQTDAAINPGNSGGALVSMDGKLVGINTAIFSKTGGSLGIGFAVPSNMVRFVVDGLLQSGSVTRPWLGAWGQAVTSDLAEALGLDRPVGVLVNDMWPGAAAQNAGIKAGDVILSIKSRDVHDPNELKYRIASLQIGGVVGLSIYRDGEIIQLNLPLEKAPETPLRDLTKVDDNSLLAGSVIANISPALVEELNLGDFTPGVIILEIERNSQAAQYRFRPGDRVLEMNGVVVTSVDHLIELINQSEHRWEIAVGRNGKVLTLRVKR